MNTRWVIRYFVAVALSTVAGGGPTAVFAQAPIKIGLVQGFTGPLEVYAKQAKRGFDLGHVKRFNEPPDFFTCGGFAAAMAAVAGIQKAGGTDSEKLVAAKGKMVSRPDVAWLVPTLVRELSPQETAPAITNKR